MCNSIPYNIITIVYVSFKLVYVHVQCIYRLHLMQALQCLNIYFKSKLAVYLV